MKKLVSFLLAVLILFSVAYAETVVQKKMKLSIRNTTLSGVYTGDIKKDYQRDLAFLKPGRLMEHPVIILANGKRD